MGILEDTERDVRSLPELADLMTSRHWGIARRATRRVGGGMREFADGLPQFWHVDEHSRDVERAWYKATLDRGNEAVAAFGVLDDWFRTADVGRVASEAVAPHEEMRRLVARLASTLRAVGDPTQPRWRPPLRHRLDARIRRKQTPR